VSQPDLGATRVERASITRVGPLFRPAP